MKRNPNALLRAMARGLESTKEDDSGKPLATIFRAMANVSRVMTDEADAIDALILESSVMPMLERLDPELRDKVLTDLAILGHMSVRLSIALVQEASRDE